jgi:hypothetical protein
MELFAKLSPPIGYDSKSHAGFARTGQAHPAEAGECSDKTDAAFESF